MKKSSQDKEKVLLEKIAKARKDLTQLKDKRNKEIGEIATKVGFDRLDNETLKKAFEKLAKELSGVND